MAFWWVSQNETYEYELPGGYLWAPGPDSQNFYHWSNLDKIEPGDIVFSYVNKAIHAVSMALSKMEVAERPAEYRKESWTRGSGRRVSVVYKYLQRPLALSTLGDHVLRQLNVKYGPLDRRLTGVFGYLFAVRPEVGRRILSAIEGSTNAEALTPQSAVESALKVVPNARLEAFVLNVPIEEQHAEGYYLEQRDETDRAKRREAALVLSFQSYLNKNQLTAVRNEIIPPGSVQPLFTDMFVPSLNLLVEAKGASDRGSVRMALGQLADYRRFLPVPRCAILLPSEPHPDLIQLAITENVEVYWSVSDTFEGIPAAP